LGVLRSHKIDQLVGALKSQVVGDAALGPVAGDDRFCGVQTAFVNALHDGNFKMKDGQLLADIDGREPADALVRTVQRRNKMLLIIVGNVELKTQAETVGFQRALPYAFHSEDGIARLFRSCASGLTMKRERKTNIALRPGALNPGMVRGK